MTGQLAVGRGTGPRQSDYDAGRDGQASYDLACRALREQKIRAGDIAPAPGRAHEARWAAEGPVAAGELETIAGLR